jgi:hypothetical protein
MTKYKITYMAPEATEITINGPITSTPQLQKIKQYISEKKGVPCDILEWEEIPENYSETPEPEHQSHQ